MTKIRRYKVVDHPLRSRRTAVAPFWQLPSFPIKSAPFPTQMKAVKARLLQKVLPTFCEEPNFLTSFPIKAGFYYPKRKPLMSDCFLKLFAVCITKSNKRNHSFDFPDQVTVTKKSLIRNNHRLPILPTMNQVIAINTCPKISINDTKFQEVLTNERV